MKYMKWTNELPNVPGAYFWRDNKNTSKRVYEVVKYPDSDLLWIRIQNCPARTLGGEWCRLVPADEIKNSYKEGCKDGFFIDSFINRCDGWNSSRAKRVMEGTQ